MSYEHHFYVWYRVSLPKHATHLFRAGPYPTRREAESQWDDIRTFDGIFNAFIEAPVDDHTIVGSDGTSAPLRSLKLVEGEGGGNLWVFEEPSSLSRFERDAPV